jgi:GTPase
MTPDEVVSPDKAKTLMQLSKEIGRQIGILVNRRGVVEAVIVGDRERIEIPSLSTDRVGRARFRGLRLVHTHLNGELLTKEDTTDLAILQLDLIACVIERKGEPVELVHIGYLIPENKAGRVWDFLGPLPIDELDIDLSVFIAELESEFLKVRGSHFITKGAKDRALLVIIVLPKKGKNLEDRQIELEDLCRSAGLSVVETVTQRPKELHPKYLIGKGKIEEIVIKSQQLGADLLVFDEELTPSQLRSISDLTELRVIDRNQLILDIFAARAKTSEAKIQVELAQLRYILPRLSERTTALSRLTGGIGARGPGETKLEVDRRRTKDRIRSLERKLKEVRTVRQRKRDKRKQSRLPVVSIVGYTNSGKSTLLNILTRSKVEAEDRPFSTLSPTTRLIKYPERKEIILTDTVGFIEDLPAVLLRAFAATLEEMEDADLLIHLVDISIPEFEERMGIVESMLISLLLSQTPVLLVFNKIDKTSRESARFVEQRFNAVAISCVTGEGIETLVRRLEKALEGLQGESQGLPEGLTLVSQRKGKNPSFPERYP